MSGDWRQEPATERQREFVKNLGIALRAGMTKGEASALIDSAFDRNHATFRENSRIPSGVLDFASDQQKYARRGTFDERDFTDPQTGLFRFPTYKHDARFLVRITDKTPYRRDHWEGLSAKERREYCLLEFELNFGEPELEVEALQGLFYHTSSEHLAPLTYLASHWSVVEWVLDLDEAGWTISETKSSPIALMLKDGYLLEKVAATPADKLHYFGEMKLADLRKACKASGLKPARTKQETIDMMISSEKDFPLPPAVVTAPKFGEWLNRLIDRYVADIRANADRFHPRYIGPIWDAARDANDVEAVINLIDEILGSRYWFDRLGTLDEVTQDRRRL